MRRNAQPDALIPKPKIPGCDVSGTVVDAGKGAHGFVVGDKVFGMLPIVGSPWGGLAEYVAAEASVFAKAPESIPLEHAAALPLVGLTVMQVAEQAGLVPAKRQGPPQGAALVQAASGGVGTFAVQYLRNVLNFADVLGTTSAANTEMVKSLGVTQAIDYRTETFESAAAKAGGVDVVLDPVMCLCVCVCVRARAYIHTYACVCTYVHTYMRACMHTCVCVCVCTYIDTYTHACMHACMHTYMHAYMHTFTCTPIHTQT